MITVFQADNNAGSEIFSDIVSWFQQNNNVAVSTS